MEIYLEDNLDYVSSNPVDMYPMGTVTMIMSPPSRRIFIRWGQSPWLCLLQYGGYVSDGDVTGYCRGGLSSGGFTEAVRDLAKALYYTMKS